MSQQPQHQVFAVHYSYVADAALRDQHRPIHRQFLLGLGEDLLAAGPYVDDPQQALLLVRGTSADQVRDRLAQDPFALEGVLTGVRIHAWTCVIGTTSATLRGEDS